MKPLVSHPLWFGLLLLLALWDLRLEWIPVSAQSSLPALLPSSATMEQRVDFSSLSQCLLLGYENAGGTTQLHCSVSDFGCVVVGLLWASGLIVVWDRVRVQVDQWWDHWHRLDQEEES